MRLSAGTGEGSTRKRGFMSMSWRSAMVSKYFSCSQWLWSNINSNTGMSNGEYYLVTRIKGALLIEGQLHFTCTLYVYLTVRYDSETQPPYLMLQHAAKSSKALLVSFQLLPIQLPACSRSQDEWHPKQNRLTHTLNIDGTVYFFIIHGSHKGFTGIHAHCKPFGAACMS